MGHFRSSAQDGLSDLSAVARRAKAEGGSDTHQLHFLKMMGFAGLNPSYELAMTLANIVARMERSEIRDSRDAGPGFRCAPSGLQPLAHVW